MATLQYTDTDARALEVLLNCSSKPAVNDLFLLAFATRRDGPASAQVKAASELLNDASEAQAKAVLASIRKVILKWSPTPFACVGNDFDVQQSWYLLLHDSPDEVMICFDVQSSAYPAGLDAAGVVKQLPAGIDDQLAKLITHIVCHHLPSWREELIDSQISGPRLLDLDWRVDVKTASDQLSQMAVPTCMVELQVQGAPERRGEMAPMQNVTFEMNKEEINAMLQGLEKIRDQLAGVNQ